MTKDDDIEKVARFEAALDQLIERIAEDRYVLAVVLVGSLSKETIWHRESLGLWIIEADGVSRRLSLLRLGPDRCAPSSASASEEEGPTRSGGRRRPQLGLGAPGDQAYLP